MILMIYVVYYRNTLINPHKSIFGGNYDINIITYILENVENYKLIWFNNHKYQIKDININHNLIGILINDKSGLLNNHWYTILKVNNNIFYNLNSKLDSFILINDIYKYLQNEIKKKNFIFLIYQSIENKFYIKS